MNSRPAKSEEVLLIYGTGFGPTNPPAPAGKQMDGAAPLANPGMLSITIGGVPATVQYAGLVGPGEYQFNVVVPALSDAVLERVGGISPAATSPPPRLPPAEVSAYPWEVASWQTIP